MLVYKWQWLQKFHIVNTVTPISSIISVGFSSRHVLFQLPGAHADHAGPECTRISPFPPGSRNPRGVVGDLWQVFAQVKSVCLHFIYFCQRKSIMEKTWPLRHGALTLLSRCVCVCRFLSLTSPRAKHLGQQKLHRHLIQTNVATTAAVDWSKK
jgi:hypothetical protein